MAVKRGVKLDLNLIKRILRSYAQQDAKTKSKKEK